MTKYNYLHKKYNTTDWEKLTEEFDKIGKDGWRLFQMSNSIKTVRLNGDLIDVYETNVIFEQEEPFSVEVKSESLSAELPTPIVPDEWIKEYEANQIKERRNQIDNIKPEKRKKNG